MNTTLLKRARSLFNTPGVPASTRRHNIRAWARSVAHLGDKWLLASKVTRITPPPQPGVWPFPPPGGPVPWTRAQIAAYKHQQHSDAPEALL